MLSRYVIHLECNLFLVPVKVFQSYRVSYVAAVFNFHMPKAHVQDSSLSLLKTKINSILRFYDSGILIILILTLSNPPSLCTSLNNLKRFKFLYPNTGRLLMGVPVNKDSVLMYFFQHNMKSTSYALLHF